MQSITLFREFILKPIAYLDPGTGSLLIQILLAGLLGIGVAVRIFWDKIINFFPKNKNRNQEVHDPTALEDEKLE